MSKTKFKNLDELEQAVLEYDEKYSLRGLNIHCGWDNCAIACRLKELKIYPKNRDLYFCLSDKAVNAGMYFNDSLKAEDVQSALKAIKKIRKMEVGFFK